MDQVLYDLMDWAGIEEIVYSEAANPERLLGAHEVEEGLLIQVFMPHAVAVAAKVGNKSYPMELQDEAGYYAVLLHGKKMSKYLLEITYDNGTTEELQDPYAFPSQFTDAELKKFDAGIYYDVYRKMGAHPMTIDGVSGVYFAVWAPCAMRVSVVGDFNMWDGRRHQMKRLGDSGVFELFMPGLKAGTLYKYEIKNHRGEPMLKSDPYGNYSELRPDNASIVWDLEQFTWSDEVWMKNRELEAAKDKPLSIYELHLGSWMRHELKLDEDGEPVTGSEFYNYREIAPKLAEYVKKLGCTALRCPWLAERIEAGVVGYREAVLETFPHERRLFQRLNLLIKHYPGSLWSNEQHERRMQYQCAVQGYRRRRDTNAYYAAMYLLTSNDDIYRRTANCFCKDGIEFGYAVLKNTSPHNYALFMAARDLCDKTEAVTMADLAEPEVIDPEALRLIVNATLIARYGLAAFQIRARGADYER